MAADDLKLGLLELKSNYKLMMVGSLEADIKNVSNKPFDTNEVVDDFDDSDSDKDVPIQNTQVLKYVLQFLTSSY